VPRIRSLKPEIFVSPQIMNVSRDARLLFIGLITQADDEGRGLADVRKLRATTFPGDDDITSASIDAMLGELAREQLVILYGPGFYALPTWGKHQKISKPRASSFPDPSGTVVEGSRNTSGTFPEDSGSVPDALRESSNGKGSEGRGSDQIKEGKGPARRDGGFEAINESVYKLVSTGSCKPEDVSGIAAVARITERQVRVSLGQLRERGRIQ
jgi:hypothetical protein